VVAAVKLSVIVPTRDKAETLERALASYVNQTHREFEVVIADDGSADDAAERVAARFRDRVAIVYERAPHRGRAACRNRALARASGELVVFADDDRLAPPDFLAEHARLHDGAPLVVLGAQRRIAGATVDDVVARWDALAATSGPEPWWEDACVPLARAYGERLDGFRLPWSLGATGNLSAPRALIAEAGGFDERFVGWGVEDLELCYRLHHLGARTVIGARAINFHLAHPRGADGERWIEWLANLVRFVEKHDRVDAAAYAYAYTRQAAVDVRALDRTIGALLDGAAASPATTAALRDAYAAIVRARVAALAWSGAHRLPGVRW
jgi:glycosyltransferase involved in cell wall biosynthesis